MRSRFIKLVEEGDLSFSQVCARFGISRKTGYKWLQRYREEGDAGLLERSRAPHQHGRRVSAAVEAAVRAILDAHPDWSDSRVRAALEAQAVEPLPALSTIGAIARRTEAKAEDAPGGSRSQANDRWRLRVGPPSVAFGRQHRAYLVQDEATGFVLAADVLPEEGEGGQREILERAWKRHGLPGRLVWPSEGPAEGGAGAEHSPLTVACLRQGIQVEFAAPKSAVTSAETDAANWDALRSKLRHLPGGADLGGLGRRTATGSPPQADPWAVLAREWRESLPRWRGRLSAWVDAQNGGAPDRSESVRGPAALYRPSRRQWDTRLDGVPSPVAAPDAELRRRVSEKGLIHFNGQRWLLGRAFAGCDVDLAPLLEDGRLRVSFASYPLGWLEDDGADLVEGAMARRVLPVDQAEVDA